MKIAWERRKRIGSSIFLLDRDEIYVNVIGAILYIFCVSLKKVGRPINGVAPVTRLLALRQVIGIRF